MKGACQEEETTRGLRAGAGADGAGFVGHRGPGWQYAWTEIAKAVKEGKIRHAGVSNFSSMLRRGIEEEILLSGATSRVSRNCGHSRRAGRTVAEAAIAWVLRRPEVTAAIVGGRRPEHVAETIRAADWDLSPEEIAEVDALVAAREAQG